MKLQKRSTFCQEHFLEELKRDIDKMDETMPSDSGEIIATELIKTNRLLALIADRLTDIADELRENGNE